MKGQSLHHQLLIAIAGITIVTGLLQLIWPGFVLAIVSAASTPTSRHFFAIIGMFMVLFGGLLLQALQSPSPPLIAIFWASLQKFGASIALGIGVMTGLFSPLAFLIAGFDLLSGVLIVWYWFQLRERPQGQCYE